MVSGEYIDFSLNIKVIINNYQFVKVPIDQTRDVGGFISHEQDNFKTFMTYNNTYIGYVA